MDDHFDVIAVSPHPDDAEIGCGGTLAKLARKFHVGIIDLTNGEPTPFNDNPEVRIKESLKSAKILGIERILLDLPNRKLMDNIDARIALAKVFRQTKPKIVIGMQGMTPQASLTITKVNSFLMVQFFTVGCLSGNIFLKGSLHGELSTFFTTSLLVNLFKQPTLFSSLWTLVISLKSKNKH